MNPISDRTDALEICKHLLPANPYTHLTSYHNPITTGILSIILSYIGTDLYYTLIWLSIIGITLYELYEKRKLFKWIDLMVIAVGFFLAYDRISRDLTELYAGLPFIYFAYKVKDKKYKGIFFALAILIRPIYGVFIIKYLFEKQVWYWFGITLIGLTVLFIIFTGMYNFIDFNNYYNLITVTPKMKFIYNVLDFSTLLIIPYIWFNLMERKK